MDHGAEALGLLMLVTAFGLGVLAGWLIFG